MNRRVERLDDELPVASETTELADELVDMADLADIRSVAAGDIEGGCFLVAVRETGDPVSVHDIADELDAPAKRVIDRSQELVDTFNLDMEPVSATKYIDRYIDNLNTVFDANLGDRIRRDSRNLTERVEVCLSGHPPSVIAATCIYLVAQSYNKRLTQDEVAEITGHSRFALVDLVNVLEEPDSEK